MENKELNTQVEALEEFDYEDYDGEYEGGGILKKVIIGAVGTAAAVGGAVVVKNRKRIADWRTMREIRKLEKKGFVVEAPEIEAEVVNVEDVDDNEEE